MRISCSIVCYRNEVEEIAQVLDSVRSSRMEVGIYVIDNSPDDALAALAAKFEAHYVHLPHNPGFGAAHNVAIGMAMDAGSEFHLVLNPDIRFAANVLPALIDYVERHGDIGLLMPNIHYPDGQQQFLCKLLPNPVDLMLRRFFPALYRISGRLAWYEMHSSGYDKIMDVPALSGCFMLLRTSVLREVGSFDERFFMYLEDVDLSRRIGSVSRTVYFPYATAIHDYRKGSYKNLRLLYFHARSAIQYFNKWGWFSDAEKRRINQSAIEKVQAANHLQKNRPL